MNDDVQGRAEEMMSSERKFSILDDKEEGDEVEWSESTILAVYPTSNEMNWAAKPTQITSTQAILRRN